MFLTLWYYNGFFSIFQYSVFTENGNFHFFFKSFPQHFLVSSHTSSHFLRLCKFKKVGLKFVTKMSLQNMKIKSKLLLTSIEENDFRTGLLLFCNRLNSRLASNRPATAVVWSYSACHSSAPWFPISVR